MQINHLVPWYSWNGRSSAREPPCVNRPQSWRRIRELASQRCGRSRRDHMSVHDIAARLNGCALLTPPVVVALQLLAHLAM
jgi:hypothetical protein